MKRLISKRALIAQAFICGVLALIAATQTWAAITVDAGAGAQIFEATGQNQNAALSPVALAILAAAVALTIAGPIFRRLLGVLIAALGAGSAWLAFAIMRDPVESASSGLTELTGLAGGGHAELVVAVAPSVWPVIAGVSGCLAGVYGILIAVLGGRWGSSGKKYEATTSRDRERPIERDRISDWDALSNGDDPSDEISDDSGSSDEPGSRDATPPQQEDSVEEETGGASVRRDRQ